MEKAQNQNNCRHEHMKLCDACGKPMCADCGAACSCDHSQDIKNQRQ